MEPYTVSEIEALLISQEVMFEKHLKAANVSDKVTVNAASTEQKDKSSNNNKSSQQTFLETTELISKVEEVDYMVKEEDAQTEMEDDLWCVSSATSLDMW